MSPAYDLSKKDVCLQRRRFTSHSWLLWAPHTEHCCKPVEIKMRETTEMEEKKGTALFRSLKGRLKPASPYWHYFSSPGSSVSTIRAWWRGHRWEEEWQSVVPTGQRRIGTEKRTEEGLAQEERKKISKGSKAQSSLQLYVFKTKNPLFKDEF